MPRTRFEMIAFLAGLLVVVALIYVDVRPSHTPARGGRTHVVTTTRAAERGQLGAFPTPPNAPAATSQRVRRAPVELWNAFPLQPK
jgi:hypothetical protein